ncbi:MAG: hypothetical protein P1R58_13180 [bacterium]|nr:hypothetical protein [bacterium]
MLKRNGLIFIALLTLTTGCSNLGIISNNDKVDDSGKPGPVEGTYYFRVPGVGTVLQEFYGYSQDQRLFKMWSLELLEYEVTCPTDPCDEILPLQVDNKWVYDIRFFDSLGAETAALVDTSYVGRDTTINSELWYILYAFKAPTAVSMNDSEGYQTMAVDSLLPGNNIFSLSDPYLAAKFPASVGDKFDNQTGFESEVLATDSSITVGAGTFDCYLYLRTFK